MTVPTLEAPTADQLVAAQYQAQARLGALAALAVYEAWASMDLLNVPGTVGGWLDALTPQLLDLRERSAASAATYLERLRIAERAPAADFIPRPAAVTPRVEAALRASLASTGPAALQQALRASAAAASNDVKYREPVITTAGSAVRPTSGKAGATPTAPARVRRGNPNLPPTKLQTIQAATAKAAITHVRNGGRDTVDTLLRRDRTVVGYGRVTSGKPCYFCAMLASRGPVYTDESFRESDPRFFGPGKVKVHDSCNCMLRPFYSERNENYTDQHRTYDRIWRSVPHVGSGRKQINAFRRAYNQFLLTGEIDDVNAD